MKKAETYLGITAILGFILKLLHIPGNSFLLVVSLSTLALFYYLSFAYFNNIRIRDIFKIKAYSNTNVKRILGTIVLGFALSLCVLGILFKIQFYSNANIILLSGLFYLCVILITTLFFYFRNKSFFYKKILNRIIIIGSICFLFSVIPSTTLVDIYYRNKPEYRDSLKKEFFELKQKP